VPTPETPEDRFVALVQSLGVVLDREGILTIAAPICASAEQGPEVLHSYLVTLVEPSLTVPFARDQYAKILGAAGAELCPQHGAVIEPEWIRLRG
jgi:hypothetical protein